MIQERFGDYVTSLQESVLPPEVVAAAKRVVIDWFAVTLPGGLLPPATLLVEALAEELGRGGSRLYPSNAAAPMRVAALINGAASHTIEFDDIFRDAIYHPGTVVIPAALAAAQTRGADGAALLRAVVAGYEVSNRIGAAVNPAHYYYWHTTGTVGHFGAAAAVASVLGLDATQTAHALAAAASMAASLQQAFRSEAMTKPIHAGQAAANGAMAALAAEVGVTGAPEMLEGGRGFGSAMSDNPDWEAAIADLGTRFTIMETTQKNHASCGHGHAAIDAVLSLRSKHQFTSEQVARIKVGSNRSAFEITNISEPKGLLEAKLSTPYCIAAAILVGSVRAEAFTAKWMQDQRLRSMMARVQISIDPEAEAAFPRQRGAIVEVETTSGDHYVERRRTRKGDPDNPLSDAEMFDKYRELVRPVIGETAGEALLAVLRDLETLKDLTDLPFEGR
jgi:2-methylcitrate dehydratase PrpD